MALLKADKQSPTEPPCDVGNLDCDGFDVAGPWHHDSEHESRSTVKPKAHCHMKPCYLQPLCLGCRGRLFLLVSTALTVLTSTCTTSVAGMRRRFLKTRDIQGPRRKEACRTWAWQGHSQRRHVGCKVAGHEAGQKGRSVIPAPSVKQH